MPTKRKRTKRAKPTKRKRAFSKEEVERIMTLQKELYDAEELGLLLGVERETVYRMVQRGQLPHLRLGGGERGRLRFRKKHVEKFLDDCAVLDGGE